MTLMIPKTLKAYFSKATKPTVSHSDLNDALHSIRAAIILTIPDLLAIIAASILISALTGVYVGAGSVTFISAMLYAALLLATGLWPSLIISLTYAPVMMLIYRGFKDLDKLVGLRLGRAGSLVTLAAYLMWVLNSIIVTVTQPVYKPITSLLSSISYVRLGSVFVLIPIYVSIIMAAAMIIGAVGILMCSYSLIKVGRLIGREGIIKGAAVTLTVSIAAGIMPIVAVPLLLIGLYLMLSGLRVQGPA